MSNAHEHKGRIEAVTMPWDDYFKLRKSRRTWGTVAAIPTTVTGVMLGGGEGGVVVGWARHVLQRRVSLMY